MQINTFLLEFFTYFLIFHLRKAKCQSQGEDTGYVRTVDLSKLNHKAVGIMLKANGRRYYVSSELCPGGIFLPKPINENCLCYNGIFQVVRQCCDSKTTRINAEQIEWRMDFKCGIASGGSASSKPIRAILPITKAYNRHSSVIMTHSLAGRNISQWRKFDLDDIIIRNHGEVRMKGKKRFEIVNVKPLGRPVKIWFGETDDVAICYSGFSVPSPMNLRVQINDAGETTDCCFQIFENNTGEVKAPCASGSILTDLVEVSSSDTDIGQCEQDVPEEAMHKIHKRQPDEESIQPFFQRHTTESSTYRLEDVLGDVGSTVFKRDATQEYRGVPINVRVSRQAQDENSGSSLRVVIPRKKGLSTADLVEQQKSINEFVSVIRSDPTAEILPPQTFRFQLLKKTIDIFLAVIPNDIVPHIMLKTAFDVFYYLYEGLEAITYDPPEMFDKAMRFLDNCMNSKISLNFTTFGCPKEVDEVVLTPEIQSKLQEIYEGRPEELHLKLRDLKHVETKRNKRFIPELFDIYVEINWKVVDFVHSFCFEHFSEEFNAHHFYEHELETIFLYREVQARWFANRPNGLSYARGIFPVSKVEVRMKQLDRVAAVGHHLSRYNGSYWLQRPKTDPFFARNKGLSPRSSSLFDDESRNIFLKNIMEEHLNAAEDLGKTGDLTGRNLGASLGLASDEREVTYPFDVPEKLPPGELIWDGRAVCLHASYSNTIEYFSDSEMWGMTPSLIELGKLYPTIH